MNALPLAVDGRKTITLLYCSINAFKESISLSEGGAGHWLDQRNLDRLRYIF